MYAPKIFQGILLSILLSNLLLANNSIIQTNEYNLFINEFMTNNTLSYENNEGDYEDWIEIYNSGNSSIDIAGYYITDNIKSDNYYRIPEGQSSITIIPAKGYLILYADERIDKGANHLNFKLGEKSEQIALIAKDGTAIIDSISYKNQFRDISFGRYPDGGSNWFYMDRVSPGNKNNQGYSGYVKSPSIDIASGLYNGSITVTIQVKKTGDQIRYTLDGSDPSDTSFLYSAPINISQTSILKARSFNSTSLPSQIAERTYLINTNYSLPVLVLTTDPKNLYDPKKGIYVNDYDGRAWERFAGLEYFRNGTSAFNISAGIRIQGNTGPKDFKKKSFRAFFREGYGDEWLQYNFYKRDSVTAFNKLVIRSGYDDNLEQVNSGGTLIRDPLVTQLWRKCGGLAPQSSYSILYLNNKYHGIYDIKQSIDETFIKDHMGYGDVDVMRTRWDSTELVYGSRDKWIELINFFTSADFTSDDKVLEADKLMDLDNFISLQALVHVTEYNSWAYGTFMFRPKTSSGRWQWTMWDPDRAFTDLKWNGLTTPYCPTSIYLDNLITKKLLKNKSFKYKFINRIMDLMNSVFLSSNIKPVIDSLAQNIASEIPAEISKWNPSSGSAAKWDENLQYLKTFSEQRPDTVRKQLQSYFNLREQSNLTIETNNNYGKIKVNSILINHFPWNGKYFKGVPVTLTAIPEPGSMFAGWSNPSIPKNESITIDVDSINTVTAIFKKLGDANVELITPRRIRPGQYLPVVVRLHDADWGINPVDQTPMQINFNSAHADTVIPIKRGAGTCSVQINSSSNFVLSIQNAHVSETSKDIEVSTIPTISYSGNLPAGEVIWDNTADRLVTGNLTVPKECHLIIKQGTWVTVKKYINFYVQGKITVEGTDYEPVVITSDKWSEPWGGMEFNNASASFKYCMILNGGGDLSKGYPTNDGWHTGYQHVFFGKNNSEFNFDQCCFLYCTGKVFGTQNCKVSVTNSVTSFVRHGGEFHTTLLSYRNSHIMNLPNDDHIYTEDIDTDGFHIDYVNPDYPTYSIIENCFFVTGKDDAIDQHDSRLKIVNCWLEDFIHEGVAASGGDTLKIFNTIAIKNDQGFEAGWADVSAPKSPYLFIDHCVAADNNVGLRIGDSYTGNNYKGFMKVTNTILYNNKDNIWNHLLSTNAPVEGAIDISYSMTNDADYDNSPHCITGVPVFDQYYYLLPNSTGAHQGIHGTNMGRADSNTVNSSAIVINEIMYNAAADMNSKDWIELYNPQVNDQDISGWILSDDDNMHKFQIPVNTVMPSKSYFVLCADTSAFRQQYPEIKNYLGEFSFGFGSADQVRIFNSSGLLIDSVAYSNNSPWPSGADGKGFSLELIDHNKDHSTPGNWAASVRLGGTPGKENWASTTDISSQKNIPAKFALEQNYPNPFNPETKIRYSLPSSGIVEISVFNILGQKVKVLISDQYQSAGNYIINFNSGSLSSGVYLYQIQFADDKGKRHLQVRKMLLMK